MATKLNITIDQGSEFETDFTVTDKDGNVVDLSPYTGTSEMRKHYASVNSISIGVTLNANGKVILSMPSSASANVSPGRYRYDVEITDSSNNTFRILEGIATVTPNITR